MKARRRNGWITLLVAVILLCGLLPHGSAVWAASDVTAAWSGAALAAFPEEAVIWQLEQTAEVLPPSDRGMAFEMIQTLTLTAGREPIPAGSRLVLRAPDLILTYPPSIASEENRIEGTIQLYKETGDGAFQPVEGAAYAVSAPLSEGRRAGRTMTLTLEPEQGFVDPHYQADARYYFDFTGSYLRGGGEAGTVALAGEPFAAEALPAAAEGLGGGLGRLQTAIETEHAAITGVSELALTVERAGERQSREVVSRLEGHLLTVDRLLPAGETADRVTLSYRVQLTDQSLPWPSDGGSYPVTLTTEIQSDGGPLRDRTDGVVPVPAYRYLRFRLSGTDPLQGQHFELWRDDRFVGDAKTNAQGELVFAADDTAGFAYLSEDGQFNHAAMTEAAYAKLIRVEAGERYTLKGKLPLYTGGTAWTAEKKGYTSYTFTVPEGEGPVLLTAGDTPGALLQLKGRGTEPLHLLLTAGDRTVASADRLPAAFGPLDAGDYTLYMVLPADAAPAAGMAWQRVEDVPGYTIPEGMTGWSLLLTLASDRPTVLAPLAAASDDPPPTLSASITLSLAAAPGAAGRVSPDVRIPFRLMQGEQPVLLDAGQIAAAAAGGLEADGAFWLSPGGHLTLTGLDGGVRYHLRPLDTPYQLKTEAGSSDFIVGETASLALYCDRPAAALTIAHRAEGDAPSDLRYMLQVTGLFAGDTQPSRASRTVLFAPDTLSLEADASAAIGKSLTLPDALAGERYTVRLTAIERADGTSLSDRFSVSYEGLTEGAVTLDAAGSRVTVVTAPRTVRLTVALTAEGMPDTPLTFRLTDEAGTPAVWSELTGGETVAGQPGAFGLLPGRTAVIEGLPAGERYQLAIDAPAGMALSHRVGEGPSQSGGTLTLTLDTDSRVAVLATPVSSPQLTLYGTVTGFAPGYTSGDRYTLVIEGPFRQPDDSVRTERRSLDFVHTAKDPVGTAAQPAVYAAETAYPAGSTVSISDTVWGGQYTITADAEGDPDDYQLTQRGLDGEGVTLTADRQIELVWERQPVSLTLCQQADRSESPAEGVRYSYQLTGSGGMPLDLTGKITLTGDGDSDRAAEGILSLAEGSRATLGLLRAGEALQLRLVAVTGAEADYFDLDCAGAPVEEGTILLRTGVNETAQLTASRKTGAALAIRWEVDGYHTAEDRFTLTLNGPGMGEEGRILTFSSDPAAATAYRQDTDHYRLGHTIEIPVLYGGGYAVNIAPNAVFETTTGGRSAVAFGLTITDRSFVPLKNTRKSGELSVRCRSDAVDPTAEMTAAVTGLFEDGMSYAVETRTLTFAADGTATVYRPAGRYRWDRAVTLPGAVYGTGYRVEIQPADGYTVTFAPEGEMDGDARVYTLGERTAVTLSETRDRTGRVVIAAEREADDRWLPEDAHLTFRLTDGDGAPLRLDDAVITSAGTGNFYWINRAEGTFALGLGGKLTIDGLPTGEPLRLTAQEEGCRIRYRRLDAEPIEADSLLLTADTAGDAVTVLASARLETVTLRQQRASGDRVIWADDRFAFALFWEGAPLDLERAEAAFLSTAEGAILDAPAGELQLAAEGGMTLRLPVGGRLSVQQTGASYGDLANYTVEISGGQQSGRTGTAVVRTGGLTMTVQNRYRTAGALTLLPMLEGEPAIDRTVAHIRVEGIFAGPEGRQETSREFTVIADPAMKAAARGTAISWNRPHTLSDGIYGERYRVTLLDIENDTIAWDAAALADTDCYRVELSTETGWREAEGGDSEPLGALGLSLSLRITRRTVTVEVTPSRMDGTVLRPDDRFRFALTGPSGGYPLTVGPEGSLILPASGGLVAGTVGEFELPADQTAVLCLPMGSRYTLTERSVRPGVQGDGEITLDQFAVDYQVDGTRKEGTRWDFLASEDCAVTFLHTPRATAGLRLALTLDDPYEPGELAAMLAVEGYFASPEGARREVRRLELPADGGTMVIPDVLYGHRYTITQTTLLSDGGVNDRGDCYLTTVGMGTRLAGNGYQTVRLAEEPVEVAVRNIRRTGTLHLQLSAVADGARETRLHITADGMPLAFLPDAAGSYSFDRAGMVTAIPLSASEGCTVTGLPYGAEIRLTAAQSTGAPAAEMSLRFDGQSGAEQTVRLEPFPADRPSAPTQYRWTGPIGGGYPEYWAPVPATSDEDSGIPEGETATASPPAASAAGTSTPASSAAAGEQAAIEDAPTSSTAAVFEESAATPAAPRADSASRTEGAASLVWLWIPLGMLLAGGLVWLILLCRRYF